ncbi:MAG: 50S ribosomal protein L17 [Candidatus Latescibacteria bacterium]|nr:50S ribosomal protein L17 [Candidatus Latescibacterota bacterium]
MRHLHSGRKLSRRRGHRKAMLANLAASLIIHGKVRTTDAKAKEVRPFVERMVTFAKRGDLHARRIVLSRLRDSIAVKKLFDELGPRYSDRFGGYTRILKLGFRPGDNSPVSMIEFVGEEVTSKTTKKSKAKKSKTPKKPVISPETSEEVKIEGTARVEETKDDTGEVIADTSADETSGTEDADTEKNKEEIKAEALEETVESETSTDQPEEDTEKKSADKDNQDKPE